MKRFKEIILTATLVVVIFLVINTSETPQVPNSSEVASHEDSRPSLSASSSYALRSSDNSWPKIDNAQANLTGDLTRKNYYLVFDGSGSMEGSDCSNGASKIQVAKQSVIDFIAKIPGDANIGLFVFDARGVSERSILSNNSRVATIQQISNISAAGMTPLRSSIKHAYSALLKQAETQLGYGEYHLVVITDGEASGGEEPRDIVQRLIKESPVVLHTLGFCIDGDHSLNQSGVTFYKSANNPQELAQGLDSILAEAANFNMDSFEGKTQ